MTHKSCILWVLLLIFISFQALGQRQNINLSLSWDSGNPQPKRYTIDNKPVDSLSAVKKIRSLIVQMQSGGYLLANADSIIKSGQAWQVQIHVGKQFTWAKLQNGNLENELIDKVGFQEKFYANRPIQLQNWSKLHQKLLSYLGNHGYPFSAVKLDSIRQENGQVWATVNHQKGPLILFDSLSISGNPKIKPDFLAKYIGWNFGKPYSEQSASLAVKKLKSLAYLKLLSEPEIIFRQGIAILKIEAETRKSTQLDGVLGVLLNEDPQTKIRKPIITGRADIRLQNPFGRGKFIRLQFQRLKIASQAFDISYTHPNLLKSNFDVEIDFKFLKEDSLYINLNRIFKLSYDAGQTGRFSFFADIFDSRLTSSFAQSAEYQNFTGNAFTAYGIEWQWQNLDNWLLPGEGWRVNAITKLGNKVIRPSLSPDDPTFQQVYGNQDLKTNQFVISTKIERFWQIGSNTSLLVGLHAGGIFNNNLYQNDLFRLGGLESLRGFNENFFFVSRYAILNIEQRFFLNQDSYFLLFYNQAYLENSLENFQFTDSPLGFGLGLSFQTQAGVFSFIYSLGKSAEQPIDFRLSKIHFGLKSRF